jgi:tetrahydromethanopterin S-methyltransferase subunit B
MEMYDVKEEIKKIDDNVGRDMNSLDPRPVPTITDWYRKRMEQRKRQITYL